jgi:CheY-like chemotaxis protein
VVRLETVNESLEQRSSLLQRLTLELASAEQNERRRIANDIHDHLAQLLVLSRIKLRQALKNIFDAASYTFLTDTDQMLEESLQYTRTLVAELSPQVLQQSGLLAALKWLSEQMSSHGLMIEAHISADRIAIEHQRAAMVYQSVRELFFNVLKHAGISRAILSVWIETDKDLCITVSDQGRGFDSSSAMKGGIPEKFGLLTMRERIEALQGTFNVRSWVGEGTSVNLRIPIEPVTCAPAHPELPESSPASGTSTAQPILRALIVDDHAMMRQGLRTLLGSYSDIHIIGEAGNGQEAIDRALEHRPDLIIMDVNMPKLNGVAATKTIKGLLPHTCVIGLSYDMSTFRSMCEAGAVTCIDKALAIDQLYQVIREVSDARADACPMPPPSVLS